MVAGYVRQGETVWDVEKALISFTRQQGYEGNSLMWWVMLVKKVGLFVDWNSQLRAVPLANADATEHARLALINVGKIVSRILPKTYPSTKFRVKVRLYHGWTTGFTQTENRRAVAKTPQFDQPDSMFRSNNIISLGDIEFGDRLIDALPEREASGSRIHLPNTLRRQSRESTAEKMVDTAMASDMLSWARLEGDSVALILTADDDMVPPAFVAESWMRPYGGSVLIHWPQHRIASKFLKLEGLLC